MEKEVLTIIVEMASDGTFDCYPQDENLEVGLAGCGTTSQEAIQDFKTAYEETKEIYKEMGRTIPEYEFRFKYDLRSFFNYFDCFNVKKIAAKAGMNYEQLNHYLTGRKNAGQAQYDKIAKAVKQITADLSQATF